MEIIDLVYLDFLSKLFKLLSITKQRGLVLGLNWGHSESQTFVLFSTQYHIPGVWFSFLELHPIDIWHSLGSQRTVESKRSGTFEEGQEEKLSWARNTWGTYMCQPSCGPEDQRGTAGNRPPQSGLGAGPTHLVCSLTPDTEGCSDLPSGPVTNGSYRKGSRTSLILFLVLLTAEPEVTKLSGACMKHTYQVELNKADLPIGHR